MITSHSENHPCHTKEECPASRWMWDVTSLGPSAYWSTYFFQQGTTFNNSQFRLFSTPLGMMGQGLSRAATIELTNLQESGRISSGLGFNVRALMVEFRDPVEMNVLQELADAADGTIEGRSSLEDIFAPYMIVSWDKLQVQWRQCPLSFLTPRPGGGRIGIYPEIAHLAPNTTFGVKLEFGGETPKAPRDFYVRVSIIGKHVRRAEDTEDWALQHIFPRNEPHTFFPGRYK